MQKLGQELLNEIIQVVRAVRNDRRVKLFEGEMARLTMAQMHTIQLLFDREKATMTELSAHAKVKMPTMTDTVSRLEKAGLVRRKHSEKDRRVVNVFITDNGKKMVMDFREQAVKHIVDFMSAISAEEQAVVIGLIKKANMLFGETAR